MIDFDDEEIEAASNWHGGQGSMLYALSSTGTLSRGTIRPRHPDGRSMTDEEWMIDLAERLESEAERASNDAAKQAKKAKGTEKKEMLAARDVLNSVSRKAGQFVREAARAKKSTRAHARKKTAPAQLDREIAAALAAPAKSQFRSWQGTDSNERLVNRVRNGLVAVYLDGVVGVSPIVGKYGWKQIEPDRADFYIQKGRRALDELVSQKAPPSVKGWLAHKVHELRDLIEKAQAVREGATHQKMTAGGYAELRRSLGVR